MSIIDSLPNEGSDKKKQRKNLYSRNSTKTVGNTVGYDSLSKRANKSNSTPTTKNKSFYSEDGNTASQKQNTAVPKQVTSTESIPYKIGQASSKTLGFANRGLNQIASGINEPFRETSIVANEFMNGVRGTTRDMSPPASILDKGVKSNDALEKRAANNLNNDQPRNWQDSSGRYEEVDRMHGFSNVRDTQTGKSNIWTNLGGNELASDQSFNRLDSGEGFASTGEGAFGIADNRQNTVAGLNLSDERLESNREWVENEIANRKNKKNSPSEIIKEARKDAERLYRKARSDEDMAPGARYMLRKEAEGIMSAAETMARGAYGNERQAMSNQASIDTAKDTAIMKAQQQKFDNSIKLENLSRQQQNDLIDRNKELFYTMKDVGSGMQERVYDPVKQADFMKIANLLGTSDGTETIMFQTLQNNGVDTDQFLDVVNNQDNPKAIKAFDEAYPGVLEKLKRQGFFE